MSLLFSGFKAAASPHVASLICFLSLIFFFNRADPLRLLLLSILQHLWSGQQKHSFWSLQGPRAEPLQRECKAAGSAVPVIVFPCVSAPHCPEAALNRQAQRPPFKVGTACSFASAPFPSSAHTQVSSQGRGAGLEVGFLLPRHSLSQVSLSL